MMSGFESMGRKLDDALDCAKQASNNMDMARRNLIAARSTIHRTALTIYAVAFVAAAIGIAVVSCR